MREIITMPRIRETKTLDAMDVRDYCIRNQYYTCGNNKDYSEMLEFAGKCTGKPEELYKLAVDILEHSDNQRFSVADIEDVMYGLSRLVVSLYTIR